MQRLCIDLLSSLLKSWLLVLNLKCPSKCVFYRFMALFAIFLNFLRWNLPKILRHITVFPMKPWTLEKISGMFIVSRPIRCEMKPQKITDKPQQESVRTWYETMSWLFLLQEIFIPFRSVWKSYFLTANQRQSLDSVCSKTNLPNRPKTECKLWKFTTVQVGVMGERSQLQKNTDRKLPITAN